MNLDSSGRLYEFLRCLSTTSFVVDNRIYTPPEKLIISERFFRNYICPSNCGGCCKSVTLIYFSHNIKELITTYPEIAEDISVRIVDINGKKQMFYEVKNGDDKYCRFLNQDNKLCKIHNAHPLLCRFELKKFIHRKDKIFLTKQLPGRGWQFNAQCKMIEFDRQAFIYDIAELYELEKIAREFEIKTKIPQIIEELKIREARYDDNSTITSKRS